MKIKANPTLPYSTLNPETSSDSPSAKSNGVRLVSANEIINHRPNSGGKSNSLVQNKFLLSIISNLSPAPLNIKNNNTKANLTS